MTVSSGKRRFFVVLALIVCVVFSLPGHSPKVDAGDVDLGDFVRTGIGARALAMGGAYVGVAEDSSCTFWNPAGMTQLDESQFGGMYTDKFSAGIIHQYLSGIGVLDLGVNRLQTGSSGLSRDSEFLSDLIGDDRTRGKVAAGLTRVGMDAGKLSYSTGNPVGETRTLWLGSAAYRFPAGNNSEEISLGGSLKRYGRTVDGNSVSGWGYDLALLYGTELKTSENTLLGRLGLVLGDPGGVDLGGTDGGKMDLSGVVPQYNRVGFALEYRSGVPLMASVEYKFSPDRPKFNRMSLGVEVSFSEVFYVRAGGNKWVKEEEYGFTFGVGLETDWLAVDYAYLPHEALGSTHVISSGLRWG